MSKTDQHSIDMAAARFEAWLETIRAPEGYTGPVVGLRTNAMSFCGPAADWRYEGLLDGYAARYKATEDARYLDAIERDLRAICAMQLTNGALRNSYFDANPMEGGMPHEPAVLAAACRAGKCLEDAGRAIPAELKTTVERYVERNLLKELWNKKLQTFNDWYISDFQAFTPSAVAAAIELLLEYGHWADAADRLEHYLVGAVKSLGDVQFSSGTTAGAMPAYSRDKGAASPYLAARCLPALVQWTQRTNSKKIGDVADALIEFISRSRNSDGLPYRLVYNERPPAEYPIVIGAVAGIAECLHRAGVGKPDVDDAAVSFAMGHQSAMGAFDTAVGFGVRTKPNPARPDWRDVIPVCGWQDKIYAVVARRTKSVCDTTLEPVERNVRVRGYRAIFREDEDAISLLSPKGCPWYLWTKRTTWPSACEL